MGEKSADKKERHLGKKLVDDLVEMMVAMSVWKKVERKGFRRDSNSVDDSGNKRAAVSVDQSEKM